MFLVFFVFEKLRVGSVLVLDDYDKFQADVYVFVFETDLPITYHEYLLVESFA
jgi:hypothetical protein